MRKWHWLSSWVSSTSQSPTVAGIRQTQVMSNSEKPLNVHPGLKTCSNQAYDEVQDMPPQNAAPWHIQYLKLKEFKKTAETGRSLWPSPHTTPTFFPETGHKLPYKGYRPCSRRRGDNLITKDGEVGAEKPAHTNLVKPTLIFLVTSSPFTTLAQTPLSCQFFTNLFFTVQKVLKLSAVVTFIVLWRFSWTHKNSAKFVYSSFVNLSLSF